MFAENIIATVQHALCDPLPEVRQAAARAFDNLHNVIGQRALDDILPNLLEKLVRTLIIFSYSPLVCLFKFKKAYACCVFF